MTARVGSGLCAEPQAHTAPEFWLTRSSPEPWSAADSVAWVKMMAWDLGGNWRSELLRLRLAARTGARLAWVPRRAGDRGAVEAGCLPNLLPGGRPVTDTAAPPLRAA